MTDLERAAIAAKGIQGKRLTHLRIDARYGRDPASHHQRGEISPSRSKIRDGKVAGVRTATIIEIDEDGETIELSDGSVWLVADSDSPTAILWLPTSQVEIREADHGFHTLKNLLNGTTIQAIED